MNPGDTVTGLTGTLNDGTIVTFDLILALVSGTPRTYTAVTVPTVPTFPTSDLGVTGYTGLTTNVAVASALIPQPGTAQFTMSNIVVTNPIVGPVSNYTVLWGDPERNNLGEQFVLQSNGGGWQVFTTLGSAANPTLTTPFLYRRYHHLPDCGAEHGQRLR